MRKSIESSTESEVFVDSGGFFALLVPRDPMHPRARSFVARSSKTQQGFVTTDYVLDETATLLKSRHVGHLADALFERIFLSAVCRVEWMDPDRFTQVRQFFLKHRDQAWSFTDCFSFWLMRSLSITDALATDKHFREAGFHPLLV